MCGRNVTRGRDNPCARKQRRKRDGRHLDPPESMEGIGMIFSWSLLSSGRLDEFGAISMLHNVSWHEKRRGGVGNSPGVGALTRAVPPMATKRGDRPLKTRRRIARVNLDKKPVRRDPESLTW